MEKHINYLLGLILFSVRYHTGIFFLHKILSNFNSVNQELLLHFVDKEVMFLEPCEKEHAWSKGGVWNQNPGCQRKSHSFARFLSCREPRESGSETTTSSCSFSIYSLSGS